MELDIFSFNLALRYPFAISRHTYHTMRCIIVELHEGRYSGFGEATTNPYYNITEENLIASFEKANTFLKDYRFTNAEKLWSDLYPVLHRNTFAQSAIDCAAHDLFFKMKVAPNMVSLEGEKTFNMTDYGIEPPTALFGTITTGDEVTIKFKSILTK